MEHSGRATKALGLVGGDIRGKGRAALPGGTDNNVIEGVTVDIPGRRHAKPEYRINLIGIDTCIGHRRAGGADSQRSPIEYERRAFDRQGDVATERALIEGSPDNDVTETVTIDITGPGDATAKFRGRLVTQDHGIGNRGI